MDSLDNVLAHKLQLTLQVNDSFYSKGTDEIFCESKEVDRIDTVVVEKRYNIETGNVELLEAEDLDFRSRCAALYDERVTSIAGNVKSVTGRFLSRGLSAVKSGGGKLVAAGKAYKQSDLLKEEGDSAERIFQGNEEPFLELGSGEPRVLSFDVPRSIEVPPFYEQDEAANRFQGVARDTLAAAKAETSKLAKQTQEALASATTYIQTKSQDLTSRKDDDKPSESLSGILEKGRQFKKWSMGDTPEDSTNEQVQFQTEQFKDQLLSLYPFQCISGSYCIFGSFRKDTLPLPSYSARPVEVLCPEMGFQPMRNRWGRNRRGKPRKKYQELNKMLRSDFAFFASTGDMSEFAGSFVRPVQHFFINFGPILKGLKVFCVAEGLGPLGGTIADWVIFSICRKILKGIIALRPILAPKFARFNASWYLWRQQFSLAKSRSFATPDALQRASLIRTSLFPKHEEQSPSQGTAEGKDEEAAGITEPRSRVVSFSPRNVMREFSADAAPSVGTEKEATSQEAINDLSADEHNSTPKPKGRKSRDDSAGGSVGTKVRAVLSDFLGPNVEKAEEFYHRANHQRRRAALAEILGKVESELTAMHIDTLDDTEIAGLLDRSAREAADDFAAQFKSCAVDSSCLINAEEMWMGTQRMKNWSAKTTSFTLSEGSIDFGGVSFPDASTNMLSWDSVSASLSRSACVVTLGSVCPDSGMSLVGTLGTLKPFLAIPKKFDTTVLGEDMKSRRTVLSDETSNRQMHQMSEFSMSDIIVMGSGEQDPNGRVEQAVGEQTEKVYYEFDDVCPYTHTFSDPREVARVERATEQFVETYIKDRALIALTAKRSQAAKAADWRGGALLIAKAVGSRRMGAQQKTNKSGTNMVEAAIWAGLEEGLRSRITLDSLLDENKRKDLKEYLIKRVIDASQMKRSNLTRAIGFQHETVIGLQSNPDWLRIKFAKRLSPSLYQKIRASDQRSPHMYSAEYGGSRRASLGGRRPQRRATEASGLRPAIFLRKFGKVNEFVSSGAKPVISEEETFIQEEETILRDDQAADELVVIKERAASPVERANTPGTVTESLSGGEGKSGLGKTAKSPGAPINTPGSLNQGVIGTTSTRVDRRGKILLIVSPTEVFELVSMSRLSSEFDYLYRVCKVSLQKSVKALVNLVREEIILQARISSGEVSCQAATDSKGMSGEEFGLLDELCRAEIGIYAITLS